MIRINQLKKKSHQSETDIAQFWLMLSVVYWDQCWIYSTTAAGRKERDTLSQLHCNKNELNFDALLHIFVNSRFWLHFLSSAILHVVRKQKAAREECVRRRGLAPPIHLSFIPFYLSLENETMHWNHPVVQWFCIFPATRYFPRGYIITVMRRSHTALPAQLDLYSQGQMTPGYLPVHFCAITRCFLNLWLYPKYAFHPILFYQVLTWRHILQDLLSHAGSFLHTIVNKAK